MYETILVPTDGSEVAETAVNHALDLAETYDATVHTIYVVDTDSMDLSLGT
ncbi:universal stress protein, partial [Aeromonas veronii]|uniref:universal stress protein n=1 Tax=Aeromonas veronii TaxID=654 RepID=UPI0038B66328